MAYALLDAFRGLFEGVKYEHRRSQLGDHVASFLYEDLVALGRSSRLAERLRAGRVAVNTANVTVGRAARRGDGTFGEVVPDVPTVMAANFVVPRGRIASVEIGAETKILAKAMIKQIDRVVGDLMRQAEQFRKSNPRAICVGLVGVNWSERYQSFEGRRTFATDGKTYKHPAQEAAEAEDRLSRYARPSLDELVLLRFIATNKRPYPFSWLDEAEMRVEYAAALVRISREYDSRF